MTWSKIIFNQHTNSAINFTAIATLKIRLRSPIYSVYSSKETNIALVGADHVSAYPFEMTKLNSVLFVWIENEKKKKFQCERLFFGMQNDTSTQRGSPKTCHCKIKFLHDINLLFKYHFTFDLSIFCVFFLWKSFVARSKSHHGTLGKISMFPFLSYFNFFVYVYFFPGIFFSFCHKFYKQNCLLGKLL